MFLFEETYYVTPGLQDIVDARVRSLHENHASNPKFVATVGRSAAHSIMCPQNHGASTE